LVVNEQNQIHDRLVADPQNRYLSKFLVMAGPRRMIELANDMGMTRLCFPLAASESDPDPQHLLVYEVGDFNSLIDRIQTGRDLFSGLFEDPPRRRLVQTWVKAQPRHTGSRTDYNPSNYSLEKLSIIPAGSKLSPPLDYLPGDESKLTHPAWPYYPGKSPRFQHLHETPVPLPTSIHERVNAGELDTSSLLAPQQVPRKPLAAFELDDLAEITH
jgi:hypothetical protein